MQNPEDKRLQAALMMSRRVTGSSVAEIAKEFRQSPQTVRRQLELARREKLLAAETDRILSLLPLAFAAYQDVLTNGELNEKLAAARDIYFGTGLLHKGNKPQVAPPEVAAAEEMTLAVWRRSRPAGEDDERDETAVDAEVVGHLDDGHQEEEPNDAPQDETEASEDASESGRETAPWNAADEGAFARLDLSQPGDSD